MNLCFSKRSPHVKKYKTTRKETWSPDLNKRYNVRRYHAGAEFTRAGDEYRPKEKESTGTEVENNGFRRNRHDYRAEKRTESLSYAGNGSSRSSYGLDTEDKNSIAKAQVHKEGRSKTAEGFR